MKIIVSNSRCYVQFDKSAEIGFLDRLLSVKDDSSESYFKAKYLSSKGIKVPPNLGTVKFFRKTDDSFPVGLLALINHVKDRIPYKVEIIDTRNSLEPVETKIPLRTYQIEALNAIFKHKVGVIEHPTGSGKTYIIASLLLSFPNTLRLYVTHRISLVEQAKRLIEQFTEEPLITCWDMDTNANSIGNHVYLTTFQTLWSRRETNFVLTLLTTAQVLCVDEVHVIPADTFYKLMTHCEAVYRVGFSATPFSDDIVRNAKVVAVVGHTIHKVSSQELIGTHLAKPSLIFVKYESEKVDYAIDNYHQLYDEAIVMNPIRNELIYRMASHANARGLNCLILVRRIDHAKILHDLYRFPYLTGSDGVERRVSEIQKLEQSKGYTLVTSTIFDEGINIHNVHVIIIASGGKSYIKTLQRLGRGMRKATGKNRFILIDFFDENSMITKRHSRRRFNIYSRHYDTKLLTIEEIEREIDQYEAS